MPVAIYNELFLIFPFSIMHIQKFLVILFESQEHLVINYKTESMVSQLTLLLWIPNVHWGKIIFLTDFVLEIFFHILNLHKIFLLTIPLLKLNLFIYNQ